MKKCALICPSCERGQLAEDTFTDEFKHGDSSVLVTDLERYLCADCGAGPIYPDQIRRNHARITDARRGADGLLIGDQIRKLRDRLGLTQQDAARLFGGGANAFSKYERGEVTQSVAMDRLLRMLQVSPELLGLLELVASGVEHASPEYSGYRTYTSMVSMNDEHYRSREVVGMAVYVAREDWSESEAA
jgi:HTH-type transcriptional regulator / antitoxin MqsA